MGLASKSARHLPTASTPTSTWCGQFVLQKCRGDADGGKYQADSAVTDPQVAADLKKKRTFRTFSYRGVELEKLLDLSNEEVRSVEFEF